MTSICQRAFGTDFSRLHPRVQERIGITNAGGRAAIGIGTMENVWHRRFYTLPLLYIGTWRNLMFPERGRDIPFTTDCRAYRDS